MGINNSKVECIWRPAQSGKTRTYQQIIKEYELLSELFYDCDGFVNIVLCSNNKSLVQQTAYRHREIYDDASSTDSDGGDADARIEGNVFSWFSGTKKNGIDAETLAWKICKNEVSMVVCCGHMKRIEYLYALLKELNNAPFFTKKVNIWIDEADESIKKWSKEKVDASKFSIVHSVTLISATFDSVLKKYGKIKVRGFEQPHPDSYVKFTDCEVTTDDTAAASSVDYLQTMYKKYEKALCRPGMRLFAPGDVTRESHERIAEFLCEKGWAVLILNGERKEIVMPNGEIRKIEDYISWDHDTPEEIGKTITKIYMDTGLNQFPFAITGQICLNRGLTFQNENFLFDFGIAFNLADRAAAYQCLARMFGNINKFKHYKPCKIVTTSRMKKLVEQAENIAVNIGKHVHDNELKFVDKHIVKAISGGVSEDMKMSIPVVIKITKEELEAIYKSNAEKKRSSILDKMDSEIGAMLRGYTCKEITRPKADLRYKKAVTDMATAAEDERRPGVFTKEDKKTNVWQAVLDERENQIIVTFYNGSKPITQTN
jgi:hypothetical protein